MEWFLFSILALLLWIGGAHLTMRALLRSGDQREGLVMCLGAAWFIFVPMCFLFLEAQKANEVQPLPKS